MPKISTENQRPSYDTLHKFQKAIDKNALSIPCDQTPLGYLVLTRTDADYLKASKNTKFTVPTDPGNAPAAPTISSGSSTSSAARRTQQIEMLPFTAAELIRNFNAEKAAYTRYMAVQTALRNLILNNVDSQYIHAKKDPLTEFALVSPKDLLEHLWTTYGTIDQNLLSENCCTQQLPKKSLAAATERST